MLCLHEIATAKYHVHTHYIVNLYLKCVNYCVYYMYVEVVFGLIPRPILSLFMLHAVGGTNSSDGERRSRPPHRSIVTPRLVSITIHK